MTAAAPPLIDAMLAPRLQAGMSITVGACDAGLQPTLARACGCRISEDRRSVTIFMSATQAAPVLSCLRANGSIAVVFSQPSTHRTVQLKGRDAVIGGLRPGDLELLAAYRAAFAKELDLLGYDGSLVYTLLATPPADVVSISFTPAEAYSQTPGPKAGEPLRAGE